MIAVAAGPSPAFTILAGRCLAGPAPLQFVADRKDERAAFSGVGFRPYMPPMQFGYLFTMGQADTRSLILRAVVQTLKDDEDPFQEFWLDPDAIVANDEFPMHIFPE